VSAVDHSQCDFAGLRVTCDRCGHTYVCTPANDYYCAAEGDHCCEPCLIRDLPLTALVITLEKKPCPPCPPPTRP
jgi:hypothetical protein